MLSLILMKFGVNAMRSMGASKSQRDFEYLHKFW